MGVRDFFRIGKERSEAGRSEVGKSKKTQEQFRAIVERRSAIIEQAASLDTGEISMVIPPGIDQPEFADGIVLSKKTNPTLKYNPEGSNSLKDTENITTIYYSFKKLKQNDDGSISEISTKEPLYKIDSFSITEFRTDPAGVVMNEVDTPEFVDLETIMTHVAIHLAQEK